MYMSKIFKKMKKKSERIREKRECSHQQDCKNSYFIVHGTLADVFKKVFLQ
jgi:hypothetical protein